jgi:hypothetical protein
LFDQIFLESHSGIGNIKNQGDSYRNNENEEKKSKKNFGLPVEKEKCQHYECDNHIGVFIDEIYHVRYHSRSPDISLILLLRYGITERLSVI